MPLSAWPCRRCVYGIPLFAALCLPGAALAQPDTAPRTIVSVVPPAPLTLAQLKTLVGDPTVVTFAGTDVPIADVVKALLAAANLPNTDPQIIRMAGQKETPKTLTVKWDRVPFWTAAKEVETATGLHWVAQTASGLALLPAYGATGGLNGLPIAETPYVRVIAGSISRYSNTTVQLGAGAATTPVTTDSGQLALRFYLDPKLKVESTSVQDSKFATPGGVVDPDVQLYFSGYGEGSSSSLVSQLLLTLPKGLHSGTKLPLVSGTVHSIIVVSSVAWKIPDISTANKATQTAGLAEYSIDNVSIQADQLSMRVTALMPRTPGVFPQFDQFYNNLHLKDAQGHVLTRMSNSLNGSTAPDGRQQYQTDLIFRLKSREGVTLQGPFSLEWPLTTETRSLDVPFEIHDLTVP